MLFSKIFPFPKYLNMPAVGIDISDKSIKYVELGKKNNRIRLKKFGDKKIEEKVIEKGKIKLKENLTENLKILKKELNNQFVIVSLPEEKAFMKVVQLPEMPESQKRESLEVQLEEIVPFPSQDIVFDFEIIKNPSKKGILEIILNAFPKKIVENYAEVFNKAGFTPIVFELENQSIFRALVEKNNKESVMIIDFGKMRTSFVVGEEGVAKFSSTIKVGGEHIDKAISKSLNLSIFEAEKIKKRQILKKTNDQILEAILPAVSVIRDEATRILKYWNEYSEQQSFKYKNVKKIILCGGDANLAGLADYFAYELKKPVETGNTWQNITSFKDYVPEMNKQESLMYATAIGLALRSFK